MPRVEYRGPVERDMTAGRFRLDGRVFLLTGASGHLGRSIATGLGETGAHVVIAGRSEERLLALQHDLQRRGFTVTSLAFDIADDQACADAIRQIADRVGALDGIINNAYTGSAGTVENASIAEFNRSCYQNITAPFRLVQEALPMLKEAGRRNTGGASVINIASMYGMVSPDPRIYGDSGANNPPYYGAAKAGLIQLTRYLACHLAEWNIRVNSISPGPFPEPQIKNTSPAFHEALCNKNPMHRIGSADELIGPVLFLASDASSYVTGINLPVDGGWTAW